MAKNRNTTNNQSVVQAQLDVLLDEAKKVVQEIDETNRKFLAKLNDIDAKIDESITALEKIYSDLDQIEKEAGDEIDKLILQQAETLAEAEALTEE